ncbi:MAG: protein kinase [Vicinamibacterales bacterium]
MSLSPGSHLAQYEITGSLGSGGMGEVYRARDLRLNRDVAIKVMADHVAADPVMRQRFEVEARAVAALSHPSILSIFELGFAGDVPFAVMELLEGETLRGRVDRGPLPWRDAVAIAAAIAEGLSAAHTKGIVHRDLKPENVFLTSDGLVKVLDFGLALHRPSGVDVATAARTAAGIVLGTLGYMSPEQVTGERVDGRSDIFTAGCLLFEMLTARRLFGGVTPQEIVANLLHDAVPDLRAIDPVAPAQLRAIITRSVERDPSRRFLNAADLAMALRALLTGSAAGAPGKRPRPRGKSLAVLPFVNTGADPQIEYLTDGITESIINSLSQLPSLRVVPRSLAFRYKGLQADPATIGLALNVRTILTGRVVQQGDVLDIQAELVDTADEAQLWGERFRRKLADVLVVQEEISWQISEALRLKLSGAQKKTLRKGPTAKAEAYQEYLRGRHHWHSWNAESFAKAIDHFERALAHDPGYALAYAGLGNTYGAMAYYGYMSTGDGFPRARAAALRALELDDRLADAHVTLGLERLLHGWDWPASEAALLRALQLDPNLALAHEVYSIFLLTSSRHDEAMHAARRARALDPLSPFINMGVPWAFHFAGRSADSVRESLDVMALKPGLEEAGNIAIMGYEALGRFEEAADMISRQRCWGLAIDAPPLLEAYRERGAEGYWRERLAQMEQNTNLPPGVGLAFAIVHCYLGQSDRAIDYLERMVDARAGGAIFIGTDSVLARLRGMPRYDALVTRIGMPRPQTV